MKKKIVDLTDKQLQNFIDNHKARNATDRPQYREALEEQARRQGFDFDTSYKFIRAAAAEGRFVAYKDLADASGAEWSRVYRLIGSHLWSLVEYADKRGWPMLSAVVVNKPNVQTGMMDPDTLQGFVEAARQLGYDVRDPEGFLREQQKRVFAWAQGKQMDE